MNYKVQSDQIRIAILLVKNKKTSNALRTQKLNDIAGITGMWRYDNLKEDFVKESNRLQKLNRQVEWIRYLKQVLIDIEAYEFLHYLKNVLEI